MWNSCPKFVLTFQLHSYTPYKNNFSSFQVEQIGDTKCRLIFIITKMFKVEHEENFAAAKGTETFY
jgi:hypothetical protein